MIIVLAMNSSGLVPIGIVREYSSIMYTAYFNDTGSCDIQIPYTDKETLNLLQRDDDCEKLLAFPDGTVCICHKVQPIVKENDKSIIIKGELGTGILENYVTDVVQRIPSAVSSPENLLNFPLSLQYILSQIPSDISQGIWSGINYQLPTDYQDTSWVLQDGYTGGRCSINKYVQSNIRQLGKGYDVKYNQITGKLDLRLVSPINRSLSQSSVPPVVVSSELGDIVSSEYYMNSLNYKNIIVAYTTIDNKEYKEIVTYDNMGLNYPMYKKRVMYKEISDISGYDLEGNPLSESDIRSLLRQKGKEILYEQALVSEYTCKLSEECTFKLGSDYNVGDKIGVIDKNLDVILEANVTGYNYTLSQAGEFYEPIIGIPQPSLTRILKEKGVI